ncbi:MAG: hypothetical protein FJ145_19875 [Deltaproteobacteria bacterium]|nr:hypothetical protein [Deltaproteobacteria bacterium]
MVTEELLKTLHALDRAEEFHVLQVLVSDLAREKMGLFRADTEYSVGSPYDAQDAAGTMLKLLTNDAQS